MELPKKNKKTDDKVLYVAYLKKRCRLRLGLLCTGKQSKIPCKRDIWRQCQQPLQV